MTRDRSTGAIVLALGIIVALYALSLPPSITEGDAGPALFPMIAALMLIVCAIILLVRKSAPAAPFFTDSVQVKRFLLMTGIYILYGILLWAVGFLISTPIMCFVFCYLMRGDRKIALWKLALFSVAVTAVVYWGFSIALSLRLPVGSVIRFSI